MSISDLMKRQRPIVRKIIQDETWLCGERRGEPVDPRDAEVREKVCKIILENGAKIRQQAENK